MNGISLYQTPPQPGAAVAMTEAQQKRQDMQCEWLRLAIAAQERRPTERFDPASLDLKLEHAACED